MIFQALGGINEHGRNCFLIKGNEHQILLDCGLGEVDDYPDFSAVDVSRIDALFVSHSHLDHTGSIKFLIELGFKGKIYLSKPTYSCLNFRDFNYEILEPNQEYCLYPWLKVRTYRSGHCFGSLSYLFDFEDKVVLYTGDYLEDSIFTCDCLRNVSTDLAIVDAAYLDNEKSMEENKQSLLSIIEREKRCLLPLPKNGRSMDVISLLNDNDLLYEIVSKSFFMEDETEYLRKEVVVKSIKGSNIILFDDPQLTKKESVNLINKYQDYSLIFTGTIDSGSMAMRMMKERKKTFFQRINVHQRQKDAKRLAGLNRFKEVVYFHNRFTNERKHLEF